MRRCAVNELVDFFDRVPCGSRHLDPTAQRYFVQPHIPGFAQFERWKDKRVLEIGCGIGTDLLEFVNAGANIEAIEFSTESRDLAQNRFHDNNCPLIWFCDAEKWLPNGPFNLIYSFGVLHHTPHPEKVLRLAHDRLKDYGELRIMLYAKYSVKHLMGTQPEAQNGCPLVKWYSARQARRLLESCGFRVVSIEKTHIFPWKISEYIQHRFVKDWPWRWMPKWMFSICERLGGHHLLIVAVKA